MIYDSIFNQLKETSSRIEKEKILSTMCDNVIFVEAMNLALNPFILFGFKSLPKVEKSGTLTIESVLPRLHELSKMNHSNASTEYLKEILESVSVATQNVIKRIVLKNLDCGVQATTWNKVLKAHGAPKEYMIPTFSVMLSSVFSEKLISKLDFNRGVFCQEKCDGMRFNAILSDGNLSFYGRSGKELFIHSESFRNEMMLLLGDSTYGSDGVVVDGELLIIDDNGKIVDRKTGNGILNKVIRGTAKKADEERVYAVIWDVYPLDVMTGKKESKDYTERYTELYMRVFNASVKNGGKLDRIGLVYSKMVHSMKECEEMFNEIRSRGGEGVIIKNPNNIWEGKRSKDNIKMKAELDADLRIVDIVEGTGKYQGMMGAMLLESDDKTVQVSVGTGFSDEQRKEYFSKDLIGKIVTIVYNDKITDKNREGVYSLFLPRFVEIRHDKNETNKFEEIQ